MDGNTSWRISPLSQTSPPDKKPNSKSGIKWWRYQSESGGIISTAKQISPPKYAETDAQTSKRY
jgi:hypothetical protein